MVFGDQVRAADDVAPTNWIGASRPGRWGTLGSLVPNDYESYLRVHPAPSAIVDWWEAQREVVAALAEVAARHTSTPDRAWFGIWIGHGFDRSVKASALHEVPEFHLPHRSYYLLGGDVQAASAIEEPGGRGMNSSYRQPDLWWPDDRAWFIATDVDFWSTYVAGTAALTAEIAGTSLTPTELVTLDHQLPDEG